MKVSSKTVVSERESLRVWRGARGPCALLFACVLTAVATSGCGTFLVRPFFPKTGAHGVVVDQYDNAIPNCEMEASWVPDSLGFVMMPPMHTARFRANRDGRWTYGRRDADDLDIAAIPPNGYEVFGHVRVFTAGPIQNGQCPTNDFILRLRKIDQTTNAMPSTIKANME